MVQGERRLCLHGLDCEVTANIADAAQLEQGSKQQTFIASKIGNHDLQQEIGLS